eukprot:gene10055-701_t
MAAVNGWRLIVQDPAALRSGGPFLFTSHPHCIYQAAVGFLFVSSTHARAAGVPRVRFCVHWALLWLVPLFKEFFRAVMWAGRRDAEHLVLKTKMGFVKLALREQGE